MHAHPVREPCRQLAWVYCIFRKAPLLPNGALKNLLKINKHYFSASGRSCQKLRCICIVLLLIPKMCLLHSKYYIFPIQRVYQIWTASEYGFIQYLRWFWYKHEHNLVQTCYHMWNKGRRGVTFEQFLTLHSIYVLMAHFHLSWSLCISSMSCVIANIFTRAMYKKSTISYFFWPCVG